MSVVTAIVALLAGAPLVATLDSASRVALSGRVVRVADVARLSGADSATRASLSGRIVAGLPPGRNASILSRGALAGLLRRAVPGLDVVVGQAGDLVELRAPPTSRGARAGPRCFALSRSVERGTPLSLEDVESVACDPQSARAPILFDRLGAVARAGNDLRGGGYVGPIVLPPERGTDRGDRLTLASAVGPVRVEREVVALQTGRSGRRMFVRTASGETIAAPLSGSNGRGAQ